MVHASLSQLFRTALTGSSTSPLHFVANVQQGQYFTQSSLGLSSYSCNDPAAHFMSVPWPHTWLVQLPEVFDSASATMRARF